MNGAGMQRSLTIFAVACALILRALVPTGWMPAPEHGAFAVRPCPAADPAPAMQMAHNGGHSDHGPDHKDRHDGDCSFSPLLAGFAPASVHGVIQPLPAAAIANSSIPSAVDLKTGAPAPPPPATGPPLITA